MYLRYLVADSLYRQPTEYLVFLLNRKFNPEKTPEKSNKIVFRKK